MSKWNILNSNQKNYAWGHSFLFQSQSYVNDYVISMQKEFAHLKNRDYS